MSKKKKKHAEHEHADERWLLTYADMITLLLALFIVLFSMSTLDVKLFMELKESLSQSFKGEVIQQPGRITDGSESVLQPTEARTAIKTKTPEPVNDITRQQQQSQQDRQDIMAAVKAAGLRTNSDSGDVKVEMTQRGIVISLAGDTFFDSGSAAIKSGMVAPLTRLAKVLGKQHHQLSIEGHTDGQPISTMQYPDNLALSTARSESIWRFLAQQGLDPALMGATGFGEFRPKVKPSFPHQNIAQNRRVEIVLMSSKVTDMSQLGSAAAATGGTVSKPASSQQPARAPANDIIGPIIDVSSGGS